MQTKTTEAQLHNMTVVVVVLVLILSISGVFIVTGKATAAVLTVRTDVENKGGTGSMVSGSLEQYPDGGYHVAGIRLNLLSRDGETRLSRDLSLDESEGVDHTIAFSQNGGDSIYSDETGIDTSDESSSDDKLLCPETAPGTKNNPPEKNSNQVSGGTDAFLNSGTIISYASAGTSLSRGFQYGMTGSGFGVAFSRFSANLMAGNRSTPGKSTSYNDVLYVNGRFAMNRSINVRK